ncbi:glycosyltransferase [Xenorhabdus szentirmaii]|uniref:Amylovoran biosynthesis glycosyltransferase AmsE n=1 Tax=Xenorhabdus szentirmaii DSM 16338 TaxID=1427518 RepID=W1J040_9GAMM|nr:glycosyltransferase [Xenorhabdus szentirmaii]PHM34345.1 putative UDP-galactose--lipooligosaccharide galactosyltransferase [Xenorhabdus szentirmaii DSM 16338]CDL84097.1 Amylovoran biosynthesis glycosyltransferase AmsE [Xenorhabdus szentirmaii DSM 16338]
MYNFSVLMSVYNKEQPEFFDQALLSVYEQTYKSNEIVIVQDGKLTQELYNVIEEWREKLPIKDVILEKNQGLGEALNIGLNSCTNDLIMRVDTDDINKCDRFEVQYIYMNNNPQITVCGSHIAEFDENPSDIKGYRRVPLENEINSVINKRNPINHMTACFRKKQVLSVGGYQHLQYMEDYYLWVRLYSKGFKLENLDKVLVLARTGKNMLRRRRGIVYFKSEINMLTKLLKLDIGNKYSTIMYFSARAAIRLIPSLVLSKLYYFLRKK